MSEEATAIERTTEFKREVIASLTLTLPAAVPVVGLGPNVDEEAALGSALASRSEFAGNNLVPVLKADDECFWDPGKDRWTKQRLFLLYSPDAGRFLTIADAVDRYAAKAPSANEAALQELRQIPITVFARWTTDI